MVKLIIRTDLVSHIAEIAVKSKNVKREVVALDLKDKEQIEDMPHIIWRVALKNTEEIYILDFSGRNLVTTNLSLSSSNTFSIVCNTLNR